MPRPAGGALALLCAGLADAAHGRALDGDSTAALSDSGFVQLAGLAGRHLVTPMLAACFCRPELERSAPEDFRLYLQFIHAENRRRNAALAAELADVAAGLNRIGVEPVLLKGAIRLVDRLYPDPGWRFMRDLDLLVPRAEASAAASELKARGYAYAVDAAAWPREHRHLPGLARGKDRPVIELHLDLLPKRRELCPAEDVRMRSRAVEFGGARVRLPDRIDQLVHLVAHDRLDRDLRRSGSFLLRSLFETALLCHGAGAAELLLARFAECGLRGWAGVHLHLTKRLFPSLLLHPPRLALSDRLQGEVALALERLDVDWTMRGLFSRARRSSGRLLRLRPLHATD